MLKQNFKDEDDEPHTCMDNAISTLGKCIYRHSANALITPAITEMFLSKLPLVVDATEA